MRWTWIGLLAVFPLACGDEGGTDKREAPAEQGGDSGQGGGAAAGTKGKAGGAGDNLGGAADNAGGTGGSATPGTNAPSRGAVFSDLALDAGDSVTLLDSFWGRLVKYDQEGTLLWETNADADLKPGLDSFAVAGMAVDADGNIYVATNVAHTNVQATALLKYAPDGEQLFRVLQTSAGGVYPAGLVFSEAENVLYVVGKTHGALPDLVDIDHPHACTASEAAEGTGCHYLSKVSLAGEVLWSKQYGGMDMLGRAADHAVATDEAGNAYTLFPDQSGLTDVPLLTRVNPDGVATFELRFGETNQVGNEVPWGPSFTHVAVAPDGASIYLAGVSRLDPSDPTFDTELADGMSVPVVVRYDAEGEYQWGVAIEGTPDDPSCAASSCRPRASLTDLLTDGTALYLFGQAKNLTLGATSTGEDTFVARVEAESGGASWQVQYGFGKDLSQAVEGSSARACELDSDGEPVFLVSKQREFVVAWLEGEEGALDHAF